MKKKNKKVDLKTIRKRYRRIIKELERRLKEANESARHWEGRYYETAEGKSLRKAIIENMKAVEKALMSGDANKISKGFDGLALVPQSLDTCLSTTVMKKKDVARIAKVLNLTKKNKRRKS